MSVENKGIIVEDDLDSAGVEMLTAISTKVPDARVAETDVEILSQNTNSAYAIVTQNMEKNCSIEDNCTDSDKIIEKTTCLKIVEETQEFSSEIIEKKSPKNRKNNDVSLPFDDINCVQMNRAKCETSQNSSDDSEKASSQKKYETQVEELQKVKKTNEVESTHLDDPKDENEVISPNIYVRISPKLNRTFSFDVNVIQKENDNRGDAVHFTKNSSNNISIEEQETEDLCTENAKVRRVENLPVYFDDNNFNQVGANSQDVRKVNYSKNISKKINPKLSPVKKNEIKIGRDSSVPYSSNDEIFELPIVVATFSESGESFMRSSLETEEKILSPKVVGESKECIVEKIERKSSQVSFGKLNDIQVECCQTSPKNKMESLKTIEETEELCSGSIEYESPVKVRRVEAVCSDVYFSQEETVNRQVVQGVNSQNPSKNKNLKLSSVKKRGTEQTVSDMIGRVSPEAQKKDRLPSSNHDKNSNPVEDDSCDDTTKIFLQNSFQDKGKLLSSKTIEKCREFSGNTERKSTKVRRRISFDDFNDKPFEIVNSSDGAENVLLINSPENREKELNPKIREGTERFSAEIERRSPPTVRRKDGSSISFEGLDDNNIENFNRIDDFENVNIDDAVESNFQHSSRNTSTNLSSRECQDAVDIFHQNNIKKSRRESNCSSSYSDDSQVWPIIGDDVTKEFSENKNKMLSLERTCGTFASFDEIFKQESLKRGTNDISISFDDNISQISNCMNDNAVKNYNKTAKNKIETSIRSNDSVYTGSPSVLGKSKSTSDNQSPSSFKSPCFCGYESSDCNSQEKSSRQKRKKSKVKRKRLSFTLRDTIEKKVLENSTLKKIKDFFFSSDSDKNTCLSTNVGNIRDAINIDSISITEKYKNGTVNTKLEDKRFRLIEKNSKKEIEVSGTVNHFLVNDNINAGCEARVSPKKKRRCTDEESPTAYVSESNVRKLIKKVKYSKNDTLNTKEVMDIFNKGNLSAHDSKYLDKTGLSSSKKQQKNKKSKDVNHGWMGRDEVGEDCDTNIDQDECINNKKKRKHKKNVKSWNEGEIEMENYDNQYSIAAGAFHQGGLDGEEGIIHPNKKKYKSKHNEDIEPEQGDSQYRLNVSASVNDEEEEINSKDKRKHKKKDKLKQHEDIEPELDDSQYRLNVSAVNDDEKEIHSKDHRKHKKKDKLKRHEELHDSHYRLNVSASVNDDEEEEKRKHKKKDKLKKHEDIEPELGDSQYRLNVSASANDDEEEIHSKEKRKHKKKDKSKQNGDIEAELGDSQYRLNVSASVNYDEEEIHSKEKRKHKKKDKLKQHEDIEAELGDSQYRLNVSASVNDDEIHSKEKRKHKKKNKLYNVEERKSQVNPFSLAVSSSTNSVHEEGKYKNVGREVENEDNECNWFVSAVIKEKSRSSNDEARVADGKTADRDLVLISKEKLRSTNDEEKEADVNIADYDLVSICKEKLRSSYDEEKEADNTIADQDLLLKSMEKSRSSNDEEKEADNTIADQDLLLKSMEKSRSSNDEEKEADNTIADQDLLLKSMEKSRSSNDEEKEADNTIADQDLLLKSMEKSRSSNDEEREADGTIADHEVVLPNLTERNYKRIRKNSRRSARLSSPNHILEQKNSSGEIVEDSSEDEDSTFVPRIIKEVNVADYLDHFHGLNEAKLNETLVEISQKKEQLMNTLINQKIKVDWKVPKSLRKANLTQTNLPKFTKHFSKGRFTRKETSHLWKAWQEFCEISNADPSDFSACTPDPISGRKLLYDKKNLNLVLYLSKYMQDRLPASVQRKLMRMSVKTCRSYTAEEDQFLIEMYKRYNGSNLNAVCALLLNRHHNNIFRRYRKLIESGLIDEECRMKIHGDELERRDLRNRILQSLMRKKGSDLKLIYRATWYSIGQEFLMSPGKAKLIFFAELYPQLFARRPLSFYTYVIELIERLKNVKRLKQSWEGLPWCGIARNCHHTSPIFLYTFLRQFVMKHVPSYVWTHLHECIEYIDETVIPIFKEKIRNGEDCWYLRQINIVE